MPFSVYWNISNAGRYNICLSKLMKENYLFISFNDGTVLINTAYMLHNIDIHVLICSNIQRNITVERLI